MMKKNKKANGVQLLIRAVVKDPDGKVLTDTGQKPSKSFLIQFLEFIYYLASAPAVGNATQISGAESAIYFDHSRPNTCFMLAALVNDSDYGIVVGTGEAGETNTDYKLGTQLVEGTGAGQITHGAQIIDTTGIVGANVDLETKRAFTNSTGSTIIVKEAGIYVKLDEVHCIIRDVLVSAIDVPDACSLTVYYTFRTTV